MNVMRRPEVGVGALMHPPADGGEKRLATPAARPRRERGGALKRRDHAHSTPKTL
jgi:hypothetical protein